MEFILLSLSYHQLVYHYADKIDMNVEGVVFFDSLHFKATEFFSGIFA